MKQSNAASGLKIGTASEKKKKTGERTTLGMDEVMGKRFNTPPAGLLASPGASC